jgi:hypothetical protein
MKLWFGSVQFRFSFNPVASIGWSVVYLLIENSKIWSGHIQEPNAICAGHLRKILVIWMILSIGHERKIVLSIS